MIATNSAIAAPFRRFGISGDFMAATCWKSITPGRMVNSRGYLRFGRGEAHNLARRAEHFRTSDVTFWGVGALGAWGLALLLAGASALLPNGLLSGLHTSLRESASIGQLQAQLADLDARARELKADNSVLMQRVALGEQANGETSKRLGALEVSVPQLIEAVNSRPPAADNTIVTGAIGTPAPPTMVSAEGGTMSYTTTPLTPGAASSAEAALQPMPSALQVATPNANAFGVALGPPVLETEGNTAWSSMNDRAGTLLLGLTPLLATIEGAPGRRLVAGPLLTEADAQALCGGFAKLGIACATAPFMGSPVPGE
jgi:hypothetical protein